MRGRVTLVARTSMVERVECESAGEERKDSVVVGTGEGQVEACG